MRTIAKIFSPCYLQSVRLPKAFRVDVEDMLSAKNEVTGEITLKPKPAPDALAVTTSWWARAGPRANCLAAT